MKSVGLVLLAASVGYWMMDAIRRNVPVDRTNMTSFLQKIDYHVETHKITTEDGYVLTLLRLPRSKNETVNTKRPVVLLVHGVMSSSMDFLAMGPNHALGFILADNGYDVWLLNCRGSTLSLDHTTLTSEEQEYWNFSVGEVAQNDLPVAINYILDFTDSEKLSYIGHSQGCTVLNILLSIRPEYNGKIKVNIIYGGTSAPCVKNTWPYIGTAIEWFRLMTLYRNLFGDFNVGQTSWMRTIVLGNSTWLESPARYEAIDYIHGKITTYLPEGASFKQMVHFGQMAGDCIFRPYHELWEEQPKPYDLSNIDVPVYAFVGLNDTVCYPIDSIRFRSELRNGFEETILVDDWTHMDFAYSYKAKAKVFDKTVQILNKVNSL